MELLNECESVLNCPICRTSTNRMRKCFPYTKEFTPEFHHFCQHNFVPVFEDPSYQEQEKFKRSRNITFHPKHMSPHKEGYEQIYRKLLEKKVKSNHKLRKHHIRKSEIVCQVYTLTTDPKNKESRSIYTYPYSSSSSDTTFSVQRRTESKKRSVTLHPSTKLYSDEETTDSEFTTCDRFPITERHYRHIVDGVKCPSNYGQSYSKNKSHEDKFDKVTRRADIEFDKKYLDPAYWRNIQEQLSKPKKKCNCKNKCVQAAQTKGSDSELSEKTFTKFINSLHSYVNKAKKYKKHKNDSKKADVDSSSCTMCKLRAKYLEKKSKDSHGKKHHTHHHRHHQRQRHHQQTRHKLWEEEKFSIRR